MFADDGNACSKVSEMEGFIINIVAGDPSLIEHDPVCCRLNLSFLWP